MDYNKFMDNKSGWRSSARYGRHLRCNICDTREGAFYRDPDKNRAGHVCSKCMASVQDVKMNWSLEDDLKLAEDWLKSNDPTRIIDVITDEELEAIVEEE